MQSSAPTVPENPAVVLTDAEPYEEGTDIAEENYPDLDDFYGETLEADVLPDTLPVYRATATREFDLIHTTLWVSFDWEKKHLLGKAEITATPVGKARQELVLDGRGFIIHNVTNPTDGKPFKYDYDNYKLTITLDKVVAVGKPVKVHIAYTARPDELPVGGSAAIMSDKGLYFINHDGADKNKPQQIWTQGETESNSRWFPTIDKPNQRCTQEMFITVEDRFQTLSNGLLQSSKKNNDGTRTDHYKLNLPHAPYLFMMAIGEYAVVKDKWNTIPLEYYVEHDYKDHAKAIFSNTPEMLTFFSDILGLKYPWPKYSQVVVRDFVSGAMENTTAVIFGDFVQRTTKELKENHNEDIIAHEMFHHWFGDYVTCESWSNLTLNEGFANYSEYLWREHKYGRDDADMHRLNELNGYMNSAQTRMHDLIDFQYAEKEAMFDAHSYNKGGLVLHMLRSYVGDENFFKALNVYLTENAYTAVETHELRLAFEKITGEDLNWFFNQWFFGSGHPLLEVQDSMSKDGKTLYISVAQTQSGEGQQHIFQLPVNVDIYMNAPDKPIRHKIFVNKRSHTFAIPVAYEPANIIFDADNVILGRIKYVKPLKSYLFQARHNKTLVDRVEALEKVKSQLTPEVDQIIFNYLSDPSDIVRYQALGQVDLADYPNFRPKVVELATKDKDHYVRASAIELLAENPTPEDEAIFESNISDDATYTVMAAALTALNKTNKEKAEKYIQKYSKETNSTLTNAIVGIFQSNNDPRALALIESRLDEVEGFEAFNTFSTYIQMLSESDNTTLMRGFEKIEAIAKNGNVSQWKKFAVAKSLFDIANIVDIDQSMSAGEIANIKERTNNIVRKMIDTEGNAQLKNALSNMILE